jgi:signal transduction histidine kinase
VIVLFVSGFWFGEAFAWPVTLGAIGFAILWARSGEDRRGRSAVDVVISGRRSITRVAIGSLLILGAMTIFLANSYSLSTPGPMLLAALVAIGGLGLIGGPWIWSIGRDLIDERSTRIRTEERAEMAAHLHDSVLQTLALIQKQAGDPRAVVKLARSQERDLRAWLYGDRADDGTSLAATLVKIGTEVEEAFGVPVEVVTVGDAEIDDLSRAMLNAVREATVNAAKHSGADKIDIFGEADGDGVEVFVRDRGKGFVLDSVPEDRLGVRRSIIDRMARHGGSAQIRSTPGEGTEVRLSTRRKP